MKKLSPTEYTYMCIIWKHPDGIFSGDIYKLFPQTKVKINLLIDEIQNYGS